MYLKKVLLRYRVALVCALSLFSLNASAVLVKEVSTSSGMATGSLSLPIAASPANYFSGLQNIQIDNGLTFLAYCIDPFQWAPTSNTEYSVSTDFNAQFGSDASDVAKLYSLFYTSTLGNNLNAAGFQLALWELVADSSKNLSAGLVASTSGTNASIKAKAQAMLDALTGPAGTDQFLYTIYTSASKQDYLVVSLRENQVPEPQSYALLALALVLMAVAAKRRI